MFPYYVEEIIIMSPDLSNLPPEMQQRITSMLESAALPPESPHQAAIAPTDQDKTWNGGPVQRAPSLMDHIVALRQEVQFLNGQTQSLVQQNRAIAQVSEATGQAVAELYQMFAGPVNPRPPQGGSDEF